jgi:hypothetical protein
MYLSWLYAGAENGENDTTGGRISSFSAVSDDNFFNALNVAGLLGTTPCQTRSSPQNRESGNA